MPDDLRPAPQPGFMLAEMPMQEPQAPTSPAASRARFFNSGNAFNLKLPPVPDHAFTDEPARALDPATPTGWIACDASAAMASPFPATSPLVLARYGRIRAGEELRDEPVASGVIHYVIAGAGSTDCAGEAIAWGPGDIFVLPGGVPIRHRGGAADAVLWVVTNSPMLAFENLSAPPPGHAPTPAVHYPASEIAEQVDRIYQARMNPDGDAGRALIFSSDLQAASRNVLPTLTLAMNSLPPGQFQRPHRHNSVAVSLVVQGQNCYSMIDGKRKDWAPWATTITPPVSSHSHHNDGDQRAYFLIVQDGGLYYHARTMGFSFT